MRKITIAFVGVFLCIAMQAKTFDLVSPGGNMKVSVNVTDRITYSVYADGVEIMKDNSAALSVDGQELGARPVLKSHRYDNCDVVFSPAVAYKFSSIRNSFNSLRLDFKGDGLCFSGPMTMVSHTVSSRISERLWMSGMRWSG